MAFETNQTEKENKARSMLEEYVKEWKIFIDTCSILHIDINKFWMNIYPLLEKYNKKIIVPLRVIEELEKHKENISNAKKYLLKLDLKNLTICPLSAYVGSLLKREILKENLSKREERYVSLYLNQFADEKEFELSKFYEIDLENKEEDKLMKAYINTGLPIFEKILYNFI